MNLIDELKTIVRAMHAAGIPYAVCGGIAVTIHGFARTTRDIDLLIQPKDLDRTLECVHGVGYNLEGGTIPLGTGEGFEQELVRISKAVGRELMTLDLLLVDPLYEPAWASRSQFVWLDENLTVVSRDGLAIMKRLSGRPQDLVDLQRLGIDSDDTPNAPAG